MSSGHPYGKRQETANSDRGHVKVPCAVNGRHGGKQLMMKQSVPFEERKHCLARRTKCWSCQSRVRVDTMFHRLSVRHSELRQQDYRAEEIHRCRTEKSNRKSIINSLL